MYELSLVELETELAAELPTRSLMRVKKSSKGGRASAHANGSFGSGANASAIYQVNFNPQIVINNGNLEHAGISLDSHNDNFAHATQTATPINFGILG